MALLAGTVEDELPEPGVFSEIGSTTAEAELELSGTSKRARLGTSPIGFPNNFSKARRLVAGVLGSIACGEGAGVVGSDVGVTGVEGVIREGCWIAIGVGCCGGLWF